MSQFTEADSSVNRLNAAVTAFEKVLTEPEGTVVEMPIGAAQPSLAERLKRAVDAVTVKPAQAAAQASAAAQQAQAAQQSAAQSAADAANSAAATGYVDAPFPDVWLPFNDNLLMLAGVAPIDTVPVNGTNIPIGTRSATFTRPTTGTYFDKSGSMKLADINEPRFEKAGLLMESQATNLYTYSEQWGAGQRVTTTNNSGDSPRGEKTMALIVEDTTTNIEHYTQDRNIVLTAGTTYCYSVFVKAHSNPRNLYLRVASGSTSGVFFDPAAGAWSGSGTGAQFVDRGFEDVGNGIYRVWMTFTAAASQSTVIRLQLANGVAANYTGDGVSGLNVWGAQLEDSPFPTSYIKTEVSAVTRSADQWTIPTENAGFRTLATLFNRTVAVELTTKFMPVGGYTEAISVQGPRYDIICRLDTGKMIRSYRSSPLEIASQDGMSDIFSYKVTGNNVFMSFNGKTTSGTRANADNNAITKFGNTSQSVARFVYYIRNLRIWHRELTEIQIRGLR